DAGEEQGSVVKWRPGCFLGSPGLPLTLAQPRVSEDDGPMPLPIASPLEPMLAKSTDEIPDGDSFIYEPTWEGFLAVIFKDGVELLIQSRELKPMNRYFPELLQPLREGLPARCVVDGEIVIAGPNGLDFEALLQRIHPAESRVRLLAEQTPASMVLWDLLAEG